MASIEESVNEISTVQDHVNAQQAGVLEVSGQLEEVSGKAVSAKQEIEGTATEATGAATNLEEVINLTTALGYGPNAQEVNAAKELVEEARNVIQAASEQVEKLTTQLQAAKTELEQANAQLQQSHTTLEEAKTRLQSLALVTKAGGGGGLAGVASVSSGVDPNGASMLGFRPRTVDGPAKNGINPPNAQRHRLGKIRKQSRPNEQNTVILPEIDVDADLEAIRNGKARWNGAINRYEVHGRTWGVEPNGTAFPDSGPGFVQLNRFEYRALIGLIRARGELSQRPTELVRDPRISDADWARAGEVYRYHPHNDRGAA